MKDVLALLSPTIEDRPSAGALYALALARAHGARLSALMAEIEPFRFPPEPDNMQADSLRVQRPSAAERLTRTGELVSSMAKRANVACEILRKEDEFVSLREQVIYLAQTRDVLIVDVYGPLWPPRKDLVEGALFGSGRPLILVPQGEREPVAEKVLIA